MKGLVVVTHDREVPIEVSDVERKKKFAEEMERKRIERVIAVEEAFPGAKMSRKDKKERNQILGVSDHRDRSKAKEKRHESDGPPQRKSPNREKVSDRKAQKSSDRNVRSDKKGDRLFSGMRLHLHNERRDGEEEEREGEGEGRDDEGGREVGRGEGERERGSGEKEKGKEEEKEKEIRSSIWSLSPATGEVAVWRLVESVRTCVNE